MGYRCPVCGDPQADDVHLANHLAFTAMVRGGDHEAWLDEHVPDWASHDDDGLAQKVTELAEETDYPQVFESTVHDSEHSETHHQPRSEQLPDSAGGIESPSEDDTEEILAEARKITRQRHDTEDEGDSNTHTESDTEK